MATGLPSIFGAEAGSPYLTLEEAAEVLGCHPDTVRKWAKAGRIPSRKIGRRIAIPRRAFLKSLEIEEG